MAYPMGRHGRQFQAVRNVGNTVYLVELSNGLIKVGFSNTPQVRLIGLSRQLARSGVCIKRHALFVGPASKTGYLCRDASGTERRAINALSQFGEPIAGSREYFAGIPFEAALAVVSAAAQA